MPCSEQFVICIIVLASKFIIIEGYSTYGDIIFHTQYLTKRFVRINMNMNSTYLWIFLKYVKLNASDTQESNVKVSG